MRNCKISSALAVPIVIAVSAASVLADNPRITVAEDLSHSGDMKSCVMAAADAAAAENLDGFLEHFTTGTQRKVRRKTAMLFVQYDFGLEILDCHVIDCSEKKGELALRYLARLSERQVEVVAVLDMRRENGYWKISREKVTSTRNYGATCSPSRSSYLGSGQVAMR
jgi:hypothetical protein